jgi:hypothetical protein
MASLEELIEHARLRLDDVAEPYLWSDEELTQYLNEATREACVRAKFIQDKTTAAVCELSLLDNQQWYDLHASVIEVYAAFYNGKRLCRMNEQDLSDLTTTGVPMHYIVAGQQIRVYPLNTVAADLTIHVYRLPLEDMADDDDEPEIPVEQHYRLIDWAARCAYLKRDSDAYDEKRADKHEGLFTLAFGVRPDANVRRKRNEKRRDTVRFHSF